MPASAGRAEGHIHALDGLRGVAAIVVVFFHARLASRYGLLAVDFFLCLSGFVIGTAYEKRLLGGMTPARYFAIRAWRLYPMLILGSIVGIALASFNVEADAATAHGWLSYIIAIIGSFLLIPFAAPPYMFAFNVPFWSVWFELLINLGHAIFVRWLTNARLWLVFGLSAALYLGLAIVKKDLSFGWIMGNFPGGFPRIAMSFSAGLLIYRLQDRWKGLVPRLRFEAAALLLAACLSVPFPQDAFVQSLAGWLIAAMAVPAIVMLGVNSTGAGELAKKLGVLSYPLYAIHYPIVEMVKQLAPATPIDLRLTVMCLAILGIVALSYLVGRFIDLPLNRVRHRFRWMR